MKKKDSSPKDAPEDTQTRTEVLATDPDPVQIGKASDDADTELESSAPSSSEIPADAADEAKSDSPSETPADAAAKVKSEALLKTATKAADKAKSGSASDSRGDTKAEPETPLKPTSKPASQPPSKPPVKPRGSRFGLFNFILIILLAGAAGYYWWQQQQVARDYQSTIAELRQQLSTRASIDSVNAGLAPLQSSVSGIGSKLTLLETEQQGLREASEKLYELYGRDKNDWQLAEVEYLMRVAQHKLILQNDFEGAAVTLQAASDKIGLTADPGLLPVRVLISEEIGALKTRERADLVGMTLILAQLARQIHVLNPGFAVRVEESPETPALPQDAGWLERFNAFVESLVEVRHETAEPSEIEASVADVSEVLADNLKLARWSVLERDDRQYQQLIDESLRLFREFYDLDNAANHDFLSQLESLQKRQIRPDKPDITGSLRELQRILAIRENPPEVQSPAAAASATEADQ